jgi:predicted Zn-dependent protease
MVSLSNLKQTVEEGLRYLRKQKDVQEAEIFVADNAVLTARLNYVSHIPCNGVEEPKSIESSGLSVRAVFADAKGRQVGMGAEPGDLSLDGVKAALEKARRMAVHDPHFTSLPVPTSERRTLLKYHDPKTMEMKNADLVHTGWKVISQALGVFAGTSSLKALVTAKQRLRDLGLIVGGDVTITQERIAIGSSHLPKVQTDESTFISSFITAMVEREDAKGTGFACTTQLNKFRGEAGAEAARNAIAAVGGVRIKGGEYRVILGPQPVADLLNNLILPSLSADSFYDRSSAFHGHLGRQVAPATVSMYDHGALPGQVGSKGITCEGLPTGRTDLIKDGILVGLLSSFYETERLLRDPEAKEKLGIPPESCKSALVPRNGFRFSSGGGRRFDAVPTISPTNVFIMGREEKTLDELLREIGNGVYIGRIWYTYPINGLRAGDFTCTVVGDSFLIQDGKLGAPLKANSIRINDSIHNVLRQIIGMTKKSRPMVVWDSEEVVHAPEIAVSRLKLSEIAGYMDALR